MRRLPALLLAALLCPAAQAQPAGPPITKIVTRLASPQIQPGAFAAQPKTLYLAGDTYARLEEEPDKAHGVHSLMVVSEPDIWMINLLDHTGRHQVDAGPDLTVHCPILPPGGPKEFSTLEFGKEVEFFKIRNATPAAAREIDGTRCDASELNFGDYGLLLYTAADSGLPKQLQLYRGGNLHATIRYLHYERGLPFKPDLFKPPSGIKFAEPSAK